ncbi:signal peptidase I [Flavobacterium branchiophilum]|uniref:Signal peptidase I n=1 Tax=Flavobacterium branchiophilum TaxID=55197 RepID=A0A2H3KCE6_9FLAO|nr:signal peptidase I [Flavobacterium branchiophilum]PDS25017.1 signal peptidase I [Flavobacterium branchiophilum]
MTMFQWFVFFIIIQVIHFFGTWKMYVAAGRKAWEAAIPVYNAIVLMKIINRPTWYTLLLFVPVVNLMMFPVLWVETIRSFGKNSTKDTWLAIVTFGFYLYYINYTQQLTYIADRSLKPTNMVADTVSSLVFALIVATVVHTYVLQPFQIPTSSLEKSLLVGDFLFVSKLNYGARPQMTAVAAPMLHDTLPIVNVKSYLNTPQYPYFRLPGFQKIEHCDIVVFNWPVDTVYKFFDQSGKKGVMKPIDKKSNYVKRCVGLPGDSLSIKNGVIYINNKELILPERAKPQFSYLVARDKNIPLEFESVFQELDITDGAVANENRDTIYIKAMTSAAAARLKNLPGIKSVTRIIAKDVEKPEVFPQIHQWNVDNYGPIYIPKKGATVALNSATLPFYKRIIGVYEGNDLKVNGNEIRINGQIATKYTFKQDYFWMMGDNRHNSEDSRFWGYVPEDHVVGKPVFIWLSLDPNQKGLHKIRWERMFTTVSGTGQPQSYFKYFLVLLAIYFVGDYFWKKRKADKE